MYCMSWDPLDKKILTLRNQVIESVICLTLKYRTIFYPLNYKRGP